MQIARNLSRIIALEKMARNFFVGLLQQPLQQKYKIESLVESSDFTTLSRKVNGP